MALIECDECNHSVSINAIRCPNCGAPPEIFDPLHSTREGVKTTEETGRLDSNTNLEQRNASPRAKGVTQVMGKKGIAGVEVTDISMSFWSMVVFMVKWAIASIPALIILGALSLFVYAFIIALLASA
jgi:hypothetical protein